MSTTRAETVLPSRRVLLDLPARVVLFLRASGAQAGIRGALSRAGFSAEDHHEGWALLGAACAYQAGGLDPADDEPARVANVRIVGWVQAHFPRLRVALERLHPDALSVFAGIESPRPEEAVLALGTWLSRLDALGPSSAAKMTLARRGVDETALAELRALLHTAQAAPPVDDAAPRAPREQELLALHRWYTDWSATARAVIPRRDYLIALGLAGRRQGARPDGG